jgi:hypothetical protein
MRDGEATLEQIEAALLSDEIARRDEALDAAYVQIEQLRVLLSESMPQEQAIELRLEAGMYRSLYETAKEALERQGDEAERLGGERPVAWFCFVPAPEGEDEPLRIRAWTTDPARARRIGDIIGRDFEPLYRREGNTP